MLTEADSSGFAFDGETYVRPDFAGRGLPPEERALKRTTPDAQDP